jgi:hypothetical protein
MVNVRLLSSRFSSAYPCLRFVYSIASHNLLLSKLLIIIPLFSCWGSTIREVQRRQSLGRENAMERTNSQNGQWDSVSRVHNSGACMLLNSVIV